jgi:hypothetical protein
MAAFEKPSDKLVNILATNLRAVEKPANYDKLRQKLKGIKPTTRKAPSIKESPENMNEISSLDKE